MAGLVFSGCVATTTDVDRLQDSLDSVQKSQADLVVKLDELQTTLEALNAGLESNQNKMGDLSVKLDDTQTGLVSRMDLISRLLSEATHYAAVAVPGDFYRAAYGDYLAGKIDLALSGFEGFLERYPDSDLADDAQFYLADCRLLKKDFIRARAEFDKVLARSSELRPQALLKRAAALAGSKQPSDRKDTLETLIKEFPDSPEAGQARQILEELKPKPKPAKKSPQSKEPSQKEQSKPE
ncbi:MAG: hypothetical protein A2636_05770 [Elusimicrobia bacterium RIFCSPHIGHO2_01_FULL_64_10]|nr:MAG: hypothetical protein A2636_05770 [Elusimicrobia bacterium RIFCSPHIGHO2_01_FULL_64_10]